MAVVEELADEGDEITVEDTHRWSALDPKVGMVLEVHLEQSGGRNMGCFSHISHQQRNGWQSHSDLSSIGMRGRRDSSSLAWRSVCWRRSLAPVFISAVCTYSRDGGQHHTCNKSQAVAMDDFQRHGIPSSRCWRGSKRAFEGRPWKASKGSCKGKACEGRESKRAFAKTSKAEDSSRIRIDSSYEGCSTRQAELSANKAETWSKSRRVKEERERDFGRLGASGRYRGDIRRPRSFLRAFGDGNKTANTEGCNYPPSHWRPLRPQGEAQGYKRSHFDELEWTAGSSGSPKDSGTKSDEEAKEVEEGQGIHSGEVAQQDPYGEDYVEWEDEFKEEEKASSGWSDCELQWELLKHFGEWRGRRRRGRIRERSRSPSSEEKQRQTRIGTGDADSQQMDQSAMVEVGSSSKHLTGGVKVASYFQQQIKGQFPQCQRELRELHHLSATLDLLRMGDLGRVGDSLAARFMALHQFMIDADWGTAKFMELHSMEDNNAATPSVVLASRKHSRLVEKVQGRGWNYGGYGYYHRGKGRGKKGGKDYDDGYCGIKRAKRANSKEKERKEKAKGKMANGTIE